MIIRVNENHEITQLISVGGNPDAEDCYVVNEIPHDILSDIFSYKYINGQFVLKDDANLKHLQEAKKHKIAFLSETCKELIESGIQIGDDHYSLTYADQINLSKLASQAMITPQLPIFYHADGKLCRQYTPEEILQIAQFSVNWVTYHTTYFNFAKAYIESMASFEMVSLFNYGMKLSQELQTQMESIISTTGIHFDQEIEEYYDYSRLLHPTRDISN